MPRCVPTKKVLSGKVFENLRARKWKIAPAKLEVCRLHDILKTSAAWEASTSTSVSVDRRRHFAFGTLRSPFKLQPVRTHFSGTFSNLLFADFPKIFIPFKNLFLLLKSHPFRAAPNVCAVTIRAPPARERDRCRFKSWLLGATWRVIRGWKRVFEYFWGKIPREFHYSHWNEAKTWYGRGGIESSTCLTSVFLENMPNTSLPRQNHLSRKLRHNSATTPH